MKVFKSLFCLSCVALFLLSSTAVAKTTKSFYKEFSDFSVALNLVCDNQGVCKGVAGRLLNKGWREGFLTVQVESIILTVDADKGVYIIANGSDINYRHNLGSFSSALDRLIMSWGEAIPDTQGSSINLSRLILSFAVYGEWEIPISDESGNEFLNILVRSEEFSSDYNVEVQKAFRETVDALCKKRKNEEHAKAVWRKLNNRELGNKCLTCWKKFNRGKNVATISIYYDFDYNKVMIKLEVEKGPNKDISLIRDFDYSERSREKLIHRYLPDAIRDAGYTGIDEHGVYRKIKF